MKKILTSLVIVASGLAFAQVGINAGQSTDPVQIADDAVLHVANKSGEHKGVLLPIVSLTSKKDQSTTSGGTVTTGLLVWNDGKSGLAPAGYYYWDGTQWVLTGNVSSVKPFKKIVLTKDEQLVPKGTTLVIGTGDRKNVRLPQMTAADAGTIIYVFKNNANNMTVLDYQGLTSGETGAVIRGSNVAVSNRGRVFIWDGEFWETVNY